MDLAKSSILKNRSLGKENNDKGRVIDGAYTNAVERNWTLKENALQYGRRKHHLEDYLAKVAFRCNIQRPTGRCTLPSWLRFSSLLQATNGKVLGSKGVNHE